MTAEIRALIQQVLAEELAALRAECRNPALVREERVAITSDAGLTDFVQSVLRRSQDPAFVAAVAEGRLRFVLEGAAPAILPSLGRTASILVATAPPAPAELCRALITEGDILALPEGQLRLRIGKNSRMTPLASDEARRRGMIIERKTT